VALLVYDEVSSISYVSDDVAVLLTPEQQSLCVQALALFTMPSTWRDWDENRALIDELVAGALLALEEPVTIPLDTPRTEFQYWHLNLIPVVGNNRAVVISTAYLGNHYTYQNPPAINDTWVSQAVWLEARTYTVEFWGRKGTGSGILTLEVRNADTLAVLATTTQDLYAAAPVDNHIFSFGVALTGTTKISLRGRVLSKNALATDYTCGCTAIFIR